MRRNSHQRGPFNRHGGADQLSRFLKVNVAMLGVNPNPVPIRSDTFQRADRRIGNAEPDQPAESIAVDEENKRDGSGENKRDGSEFNLRMG
jgi:hypothetical protein